MNVYALATAVLIGGSPGGDPPTIEKGIQSWAREVPQLTRSERFLRRLRRRCEGEPTANPEAGYAWAKESQSHHTRRALWLGTFGAGTMAGGITTVTLPHRDRPLSFVSAGLLSLGFALSIAATTHAGLGVRSSMRSKCYLHWDDY